LKTLFFAAAGDCGLLLGFLRGWRRRRAYHPPYGILKADSG